MLDGLSIAPQRFRSIAAPLSVVAVAVLLLVGATIAAATSPTVFAVLGIGMVAVVAVAAVWWPRTAILLVVLSPIVDRYIVADVLPASLETAAHYLSEAMLLAVGLILAGRALIAGRLIAAFRNPVTVALITFVLIAAVSAVLNGVPPLIATVGVVFTIDAAALFFLPRLVGFSPRQSIAAMAAIGAVVLVAALLAIAQALLSPRLFGMRPVRGRFGEEVRLASLFGDPNVFGAFLVIAVPFAVLGAARLPDRRLRWLSGAIAFVLLLALWLSFSRGAWIALILGVGTVLALVDRRALVIGLLLAVTSFGTAVVMPRNLMVPEQRRPNIVDSTVDRFGAIGLQGDLRTLFVVHSLPIIRDHPVLGVGPGRFGGAVAFNYGTPIYEQYGFRPLFWNPAQRTVDNFWLHIVVETGVLGAAAFLAAALIPGVRILG
ncbi:MAG: O-antigen ligase family protein, partial [Chloroflexota bacterium]|nr:O-antigen ligase family protein [Chloroflexota bacterium]